MNKKFIFVFLVFIIPFLSITGFSPYYFDLSADVRNSFWEEEIPNVIIIKNSSEYFVDVDLTSFNNGKCTSQNGLQPTFNIISENISEVNCNIDGNLLSVTPFENFTGTAQCEVSCINSGQSENISFSISVIDTEDSDPEVIYVRSGGGGGGGISPAQLAEILGQTQITNLAIKPESIKLILRPGESISEIIAVENKLDRIYDINIQKNTLVSYVNIKNSASLQPKSITNIPIEIGVPLNEYRSIITGTIDFDEYTDLAVVIEVINPLLNPDSQQEVELLITLGTDYISPTLIFTGEIDKKNILPGTLLKPKLKLSDFYQSGYPEISLTYYLFDMNNNELLSFTDYYKTYDDRTLSILLPEDIPLGKYALTFEARYGNFVSRNTQTLQIVSSKGLLTDELIILTLMVGVMAYSIYAVSTRRKRGGNKRNKQKTNAKLIYH